MEKKTGYLEKNSNDAETTIDSSQSHTYAANPLNRMKQENLRSTKSSPHRNVELHHTRSFSEMCHLHPSSTDVTSATICPRPRAIEELQHEVRRPESVLELSELPTSSDDESDEDAIATEQQKGDEAMKIFLESNVSIPLDGNLTSSSLSQDTLDSDVASESELVVGNWEREWRDSIASTGSSLEKRFLTPSGQLLYREHQVESMLDTKRLKLTPSSSDRPMSPLAMRRSDENLKGRSGERRFQVDSDSESDGQEVVLNEGKKTRKKQCDCDLRLQDLKNVIRKYGMQCEELISRSKEQYDEIKTLRKDNVNMHKEHNRLQVLLRECYENENSLKESLASFTKEKEKNVSALGCKIRELGNSLQDKSSEISQLQSTIGSYQKQGEKYIKVMQEIKNEIKELFEALAKQLGLDEKFEVGIEENPEAIVALLKARRQSLSDDFNNFYGNLYQTTDTDMVGEIQNRMKQDFHQLSSGYKDAISKAQKAEKDLGRVLKRSASLETLLKETNRKYVDETRVQFGGTEFEVKAKDLQRKNDSLMQENKMLQEDCSKWKQRCEEISKRNEKRATKVELKPREEKRLASAELGKLQKYLKERRRSYSETQLTTLQSCQANFTRTGSAKAETKSRNGEKKTGRLEENPKIEAMTVAQNTANFQGLSNLESRLKQLSQLTEELSQKIEKSNQCLVEKSESEKNPDLSNEHNHNDRMLSSFYGYKLFSVIKEIYDDSIVTLQGSIQSREQECRYLKEQLLMKESNEEVTQCYIESLKRAVAISQEDLKNVKNKNQDLKRELRVLKDRVLVTNAEREMSLFYCKKNGITNGALVKHEDCLDVESTGQRHHENGFVSAIIDEMSFFKKHIKQSGV